MKQKLIVSFIFLVLSCSCYTIPKDFSEKSPTEEMVVQINKNYERGNWLYSYDKASWLATDLMLSKVLYPGNVKYWFYMNNVVYFGKLIDNKFYIFYTVDYNNNIVSNFEEYKIAESSEILSKYATAKNLSYDINKDFMISQEVTYNYYVTEENDKITVWWMPAESDDYFVYCGGIKTIFQANTLDEISNELLHKSVIRVSKENNLNDNEISIHSILNDVPNEVDFALFLINSNRIKEQFINNENFIFYMNIDNYPDIEYYSSTYVGTKDEIFPRYRIFAVIFEVAIDEKGEITDINVSDNVSFDSNDPVGPTHVFNISCIMTIRSKKWKEKNNKFYYSFFYDTESPDIPQYMDKETKQLKYFEKK